MSWQRAPRAAWPSPWHSGKQDLVSVLQEPKNSSLNSRISNGAGPRTKFGPGISSSDHLAQGHSARRRCTYTPAFCPQTISSSLFCPVCDPVMLGSKLDLTLGFMNKMRSRGSHGLMIHQERRGLRVLCFLTEEAARKLALMMSSKKEWVLGPLKCLHPSHCTPPP